MPLQVFAKGAIHETAPGTAFHKRSIDRSGDGCRPQDDVRPPPDAVIKAAGLYRPLVCPVEALVRHERVAMGGPKVVLGVKRHIHRRDERNSSVTRNQFYADRSPRVAVECLGAGVEKPMECGGAPQDLSSLSPT